MAVLLYELLTGQCPYLATTVPMVFEQHLRAPVPDVRAVRPDVGDALAHLCLAGMQKRPEDRPRTATDFLEALESAARQRYGLELAGSPGGVALGGVVTSILAKSEVLSELGLPSAGTAVGAVAVCCAAAVCGSSASCACCAAAAAVIVMASAQPTGGNPVATTAILSAPSTIVLTDKTSPLTQPFAGSTSLSSTGSTPSSAGKTSAVPQPVGTEIIQVTPIGPVGQLKSGYVTVAREGDPVDCFYSPAASGGGVYQCGTSEQFRGLLEALRYESLVHDGRC